MLRSKKNLLIYTLCILFTLTATLLPSMTSFANTVMQPYVNGVTTNSVWVVVECTTTDTATVDYGTTASYGSTATTTNTQITTVTKQQTPTYVHNIKLTGLSSNTTYHYRVRQGTSTSADYTFKTGVNPGTGFRFAFYADTRTNTAPHDTIAARIKAANPDFVLFGGDLANDGKYSTLKAEYFRTNELNLLSGSPMFFTPGNHEGWAGNSKAFFQGPANNAVDDPDYYSFDYGDLHVVAVNTQLSTAVGSAQYNWVANDLAASTKPWKIVFNHMPGYNSGGHGENAGMKIMSDNLFAPNGVDMTFAGDSHYYQHNLSNGVHHMVVGSAGAPFYTPLPAPYTVKSEMTHCYAIVDVTETSYTYNAYNESGNLIEYIYLSNDGSTPAPTATPTPTPSVTPTPTPPTAPGGDMLKLTATSSANTAAAKYWYWKISNAAYTFQEGDYIEYDVFIQNNNAGLGALEVYCTDGTWFRDQTDWKDQNALRGHPSANLSTYAYNNWFHRRLPVPAARIGKTSLDYNLAVEYNSNSTTYIVNYDNIVVTNGGNIQKVIYQDGNPTVNASRGGVEYSCGVSVVPVP